MAVSGGSRGNVIIMRRTIFWFLSSALVLVTPGMLEAQIQIGTVTGTARDSTNAALPGATVTLSNPLTGYHNEATTDLEGGFTFNNVPFDAYTLTIDASGFQPVTRSVSVRSNLPVDLDLSLNVAGPEEMITVEAQDSLVEVDSSSSEIDLDRSLIERTPGAASSSRLQKLIATTPGWTTQNNGLLHIRGVDDGVLYVVDGIPTTDRIDATSGSSFDTDMIRSIDVITGNIPAEFGGRSGAVVTIQPMSGIDAPLNGSLSINRGNFRSSEVGGTLGGNYKRKLGFFLTSSASHTDRFLDPVDPRNFHNRGGSLKLNLRTDWHPTSRDILLVNLSANGANLLVPNTKTQELAGQDQRQELRDNSQSLSWQHIWSLRTVSNIAYFRRFAESELLGSPADIPLFSHQDRTNVRQGIMAAVTHRYGQHIFKAGLEAARVSPQEFFTFSITDQQLAEEEGISEAARAFDMDNPFVFRDRRVRSQLSGYLQDSYSPIQDMTIHAGLRYDRSRLLIPDQQVSPRVGAVYYISKTKTAIRGSFNRLYMPPQVENLLLADSEQARELSPFVQEGGAGGAPIRPEKVSAYEVGFSQDILGLFKFDTAYWWRFFRNFDDPNVFFNTTIIFPNSVEKGFSRGLDVRLDFPQRWGWSGFLSYTNSRILQTGPINGGLFLTDEAIDIGPGTVFIPDHDQRNVASFAINYYSERTGLWATFAGRHESGIPLEVEDDALERLMSTPGAELVDFNRLRVKPWTTLDFSAGVNLFTDRRVRTSLQFDIQNLTNRSFAYNFGNPFEGTHFGHPRLWAGGLKFSFQ